MTILKSVKERLEEVTNLEDLETLKKEIYEKEIPALELDKSEKSKLKISIAQLFNLRFHEINDDMTYTAEHTKPIDPRKILKAPHEVMNEPKKIIQKDKKVIVI